MSLPIACTYFPGLIKRKYQLRTHFSLLVQSSHESWSASSTILQLVISWTQTQMYSSLISWTLNGHLMYIKRMSNISTCVRVQLEFEYPTFTLKRTLNIVRPITIYNVVRLLEKSWNLQLPFPTFTTKTFHSKFQFFFFHLLMIKSQRTYLIKEVREIWWVKNITSWKRKGLISRSISNWLFGLSMKSCSLLKHENYSTVLFIYKVFNTLWL